jgi:uncharacterized protein YggU (UPF0235/DUF167 family)
MKTGYSISLLGLVLTMAGCTTSSKVQDMIDASYREQTDRIDSHEASIDVLKKSAMAGLEKSKENAELIKTLQVQLAQLNQQVKTNKGFAEASKVMSAANTVKAAELEELLNANTASDQETRERLKEIDILYERVLLNHYRKIIESANMAVEDLQATGWTGSSNAPVKIDEPIEIVAPTSVPSTNAAMSQ